MNPTESKPDGADKALVPAGREMVPAITAPPREPLDIAKRFGFEKVAIEMGADAAWTIDGNTVYAFGPGAIRLAREAGVCILKPPTLRVGETIHPNPYIEYDQMGAPCVFHIVKHGIMIDRTGAIRYLPPVYDRIDISAYIAERALKTKSNKDTPAEDAVEATRTMAERWNSEAKKPGDSVWWFVPVQGTEIGIAFRMNTKSKPIRRLLEELTHLKKNLLRRFETSSDRRVAYSLVYESMVAVKDPAPVFKDVPIFPGANNMKRVLDKATFIVDKPMRAGLEFGLLQELAIAIREDNPEKRQALLGDFAEMTGMANVRVIEAQAAADPTEPITVEGEVISTTEGLGPVDPVPTKAPAKDFKEYLEAQIPKLNADQRNALAEELGLEFTKDVDVAEDSVIAAAMSSKETRKVAARWFRDFIKAQEKDESKGDAAISADDARAFLLEEMAEGKADRIEAIMVRCGAPKEANLSLVADDIVMKGYNAYISGVAPADGDAG